MNEAWDLIFKSKKFDVSQDLHYITADEIKDITHLEPRILAKCDFSKDLPDVLKKNGYFLLPVRNGKYAIVRGSGFHKVEQSGSIIEHVSKIDFPLTTAGRGQGEMQYLDNAYNTGVLEEVMQEGPLYQSIRGRERSKKFDFIVNKTLLEVEGVQIEVDSGMEGRNSVIVMEAKIGKPEDFIIRQLFYPFRNFQQISHKKIIPAFLTYDLGSQSYNLWLYEFENPKDYNSIKLVSNQAFKIIIEQPMVIGEIKPEGVVQYRDLVPQANSIDCIIELVFKVSEGVNRYQSIADYFQFDERQSSYYREAAESLGLVISTNGIYELTDIGRQFIQLEGENRNIFMARLLADFHLVRAGLDLLQEKRVLNRLDFENLIRGSSSLADSTIVRRAGSLISWFKWIGEHTGTFSSEGSEFTLKI